MPGHIDSGGEMKKLFLFIGLTIAFLVPVVGLGFIMAFYPKMFLWAIAVSIAVYLALTVMEHKKLNA